MKFNKIVKKWAQAIELYKQNRTVEYLKYLDENNLDIGLADRCIVGEAYHWRAFYSTLWGNLCNRCNQISIDFESAFRGDYPKLASFERVQREFEEHWCEEHSVKKK